MASKGGSWAKGKNGKPHFKPAVAYVSRGLGADNPQGGEAVTDLKVVASLNASMTAAKLEGKPALRRPGTSVAANDIGGALSHVEAGGSLSVSTPLRTTVITKRTVGTFRRAGAYLLKPEGEGYRMQMGRSSVYLMPGQLKYG